MESQIDFASSGDDASLGEVHVHIRCFAVWESERRSSGSLTARSLHAVGACAELLPSGRPPTASLRIDGLRLEPGRTIAGCPVSPLTERNEKQAVCGSFGEPHLDGPVLEARPGHEAHEDGQNTTPERRHARCPSAMGGASRGTVRSCYHVAELPVSGHLLGTSSAGDRDGLTTWGNPFLAWASSLPWTLVQ
jgi:hypothetical protein